MAVTIVAQSRRDTESDDAADAAIDAIDVSGGLDEMSRLEVELARKWTPAGEAFYFNFCRALGRKYRAEALAQVERERSA